MFNKKQLYLISALALVLSLVLVQVQVKAAWENPTGSPNNSGVNFLTNPLSADLNLNNKNLTNGGSAAFNSGTFNGLDLKNGNLVNVSKINGKTLDELGGGLGNPLTEDLSGADKFSVKALMSCDAGKGETCGAVEAQAGRSDFSNSFPVGLYGYTQKNSGANPSYGVYGYADIANTGGVGVTGSGTTGVYGYSSSASGYGGFFQNDGNGVALGFKGEVMGDLDDFALEISNGNFSFEATKPSQQFTVTATSYFTGTTHLENTLVDGSLQVADNGDGLGIVGDNDMATGLAGVTGMGGEIGVFGSGPIGIYGEGNYGGIFAGNRLNGWSDPTPGNTNTIPPADVDPITALFGLNKSMAAVSTPGYIGLVATGGYYYTAGAFTNAGLGICSLSGELAHDDVASSDYFNYCKDDFNKNNFSGFFAGDVYVKKGSLQVRDSLIAGENLIYGNVASAAAGSNLLLLQNNNVDKFKVDKDGSGNFVNNLTVDTDSFFVDATNNRVGVGTISPAARLDVISTAYPVGRFERRVNGTGLSYAGNGLFFKNTGTPTNNDGILQYFNVTNSANNFVYAGAMGARLTSVTAGAETAQLTFGVANAGADPYNQIRMVINGNGSVGIGTLSPSATYKLDVAGSINSTGSYYANGTSGLSSATIRVRNSAGTGSCDINIKGGLVTGTNCP